MVIGLRESTVRSVPDSTNGLRQRSNKSGLNQVGFSYPCVLLETINVSLEIQNLVKIDPFNPDLSPQTRFIVFLPRILLGEQFFVIHDEEGGFGSLRTVPLLSWCMCVCVCVCVCVCAGGVLGNNSPALLFPRQLFLLSPSQDKEDNIWQKDSL